MKDKIIKKWELILQKDSEKDITYGRNVLIEMLDDFKEEQESKEQPKHPTSWRDFTMTDKIEDYPVYSKKHEQELIREQIKSQLNPKP